MLVAIFLSFSACGGGGAGPDDAGIDGGGDAGADGETDGATSPDGDGPDADAEADEDVEPAGDAHVEVDGDAEPDREPGCGIEDLAVLEAGALAPGERLEGLTLDPCFMHRLRLVLPAGMEVELEVTPRGVFPVVAAVTYPDTMSWDRAIRVVRAERWGEPEALTFEVPRSGELVVMIRTTALEASQRYDVALRCLSGCDRETTRYPIVLVHGWTGFDEIGPLDYFYGIPALLEERGYPVSVAVLDPYNSIEVRSEQLAPQVDEALERGRALKVNIIAHSQGGLDSRRLISTLGYGDRVSALVTVATPHRGTPLCDVALGLLPGAGEEALWFLLNLIGATVMGRESDAEASFLSLSEDYVQNVFNPANPDDRRVDYISWMGRTCLYGISCDDVCDVEIRWSYDLIYLLAGDNDGIVPVSSGPWGDYRGEIPADHFDEVGQLFGVTNDHFDHEEFYLGRARDLAAEGH